jgi:acyl carrier protein
LTFDCHLLGKQLVEERSPEETAWNGPLAVFASHSRSGQARNFSSNPGDDKLTTAMPTLDQTTQEVLSLATAHFKLAPGTLVPEDDFFKKLGIDSLQTLELLSRIENHFGIELPDYEVQGVSDFKTLAERIQSRL